jgi:biotin synthase
MHGKRLPLRMDKDTILGWLWEENEECLAELWQAADTTRQRCVGEEVHLRGLIEISNSCCRNCLYCGIRTARADLPRYRMDASEILACVGEAQARGYGTVVLQSGEDPGITADWLAGLVQHIKRETPLAVTLSMGERSYEELACWREAGADRYLLRFETSDPGLYAAIHPGPQGKPSHPEDRLAILAQLRKLGYEVGSGVLIGIPGQSYASLADDIMLFRELDLDMVGVGPYIAHPDTPLGQGQGDIPHIDDQVPGTELMCHKMLALTRLVCPEANIPATTALATVGADRGQLLGLERGANVVMPCLTPQQYHGHYEIYPGKAETTTGKDWHNTLLAHLHAMGRRPGTGLGARRYGSHPAS